MKKEKTLMLSTIILLSVIACKSTDENSNSELETAEMNDTKDAKTLSIEGEYLQGDDKTGEYYNKLILKKQNDSIYSIEINSGNANKGCGFRAQGNLDKDVIKVDLSKIQKDMKSEMIISFEDGKAEIETSKDENRYDLNYFCAGGGSLIGEYIKK